MVQQSINLAKRPHVVVSFQFTGMAAFVIYVNLCVNIQKLTTYVLIVIFFSPLAGCNTWTPHGSSIEHKRIFSSFIEIFGMI